MTRLKVHHMVEGGLPHAVVAEKCSISQRSVERIVSEPAPTLEEVIVGVRSSQTRVGRPPKADEAIQDRVRTLLREEPKLQATEVLRRSREWGYAGSRSAMSALVKALRPAPKTEPMVRFEGLPGEYAQFDFGEARVRYSGGTVERIVFFAARLKYSRFMSVVLVDNQQAETLVRSVVASLEAFGGSPKEWVFDNPKTVRISPFGVEPPVLHAYLRELVAEYRVIPTLCAPRRGNQKGSVERLVGFVKHSFLLARKFQDREDVRLQLVEWLRQVNCDRPSDATGVIPAVALNDERRWLAERPVRTSADQHVLRETATVTPTGTVSYAGTPYFASARRIGAPATLLIRRDQIEIIVGDERSRHARVDGAGVPQYLPEQRDELLAAVHGRRKQATARREALLRVGGPAWEFLTVLTHRCPDGRWEEPCQELYMLLQSHGDARLRAALGVCTANHRYTVSDVRAALNAEVV